MEILRFYSWYPNPRYQPWVNEIATQLLRVPVIRPDASKTDSAEKRRWLPDPASVYMLPQMSA